MESDDYHLRAGYWVGIGTQYPGANGMNGAISMIRFVREDAIMDDRVIDSNIDSNIDSKDYIGDIGIMGAGYWIYWVVTRRDPVG